MDLELEGKVVIVTGGTDGLGAALAERLATLGAHVTVCGRNESRVEAMRERLTSTGGDHLVVAADVTVPPDIERLVDSTVQRWGRIDGIVNNAGAAAAEPFEAITDDEWQADLDLKVMAAVRLTRSAIPHMTTDGGSIVNVLSIAAKAAGARSLPSAASRATGIAITKALSKELGPIGIRSNAVLVGLVESGQWDRLADRTGRPVAEIYEGMAGQIPLGRVGRGDEFADLVTFLLSARSSYVTGSAINLDGGMSPAI
ncbi:MAG: SDR family oxidoreductase [Microthrixaceae bacterium]|nr:SDR family oxidoreductase [Microthrixaceae bacterium]